MKCLFFLGICISVALARPSSLKQDTPQDTSIKSWWDKFADAVDMNLNSYGSLQNNPAVGSGIEGQLKHVLSIDFPDNREYHAKIFHELNEFKEGDGGTLGVSWDSKLPYVGDVAIVGEQSFNDFGNSTFQWNLNVNNQAYKQGLN